MRPVDQWGYACTDQRRKSGTLQGLHSLVPYDLGPNDRAITVRENGYKGKSVA